MHASKDGLESTSEPIELEEDKHYVIRSEMVLAMKKMRTGKAPGYDDIPAELIKETGGVGAMHNLIWRDKNWPNDWTKSVFLPLPKKMTLENVRTTEPFL